MSSTEWKRAFDNIQAFIDECEVPLEIAEANANESQPGYFRFVLKATKGNYQTTIDMPSIPLQELKKDYEDILETPKVFVDGYAYRWNIALVKKAIVKDFYKNNISKLEEACSIYRNYLVQL